MVSVTSARLLLGLCVLCYFLLAMSADASPAVRRTTTSRRVTAKPTTVRQIVRRTTTTRRTTTSTRRATTSTRRATTSTRRATSTSVVRKGPTPTTAALTPRPTSSARSASSTRTSSAPATTAASSPPPPANFMRGVNLGGWFVLEYWMKRSLFYTAAQQSGNSALNDAGDQYTFMTAFSDKNRALNLLKQHWSTYITEQDFAQIKRIGLNTVRIPVGHWSFVSTPSEPYAAFAEQPYIANALKLASKYGLSVILDMHTAPGSQNGFDSSGRTGAVNFRQSPDNARILNQALANMVKLYVNDAQYNGVVKMVEVLNEPLCYVLGADFMTQVYKDANDAIQAAISPSAPVKPTVVLHDCFVNPIAAWREATTGGLSGMPFVLDSHRYQVFAPYVNLSKKQHIEEMNLYGTQIIDGSNQMGRKVLVGEFSLAINCTDCVPAGSTEEDTARLNRGWWSTQISAYEQPGSIGWIFWNWVVEGPNYPWSFKDAYAKNWIPADIRYKSQAW